MRALTFLMALLAACSGQAQNVAAFVDYMDRFHVFDNGQFKQIEGQRPIRYGMGGNYVVYASKNGDLRIYQHGAVKTLERTNVIEPTVTDHYLGYQLAGVLKVYDGSELNTLCFNTESHTVEDSVVAYYDGRYQQFKGYYRGETFILEDALANEPIRNWRSGDNVLAWVTTLERKFKVFYRGEIIEVNYMVDENMEYKAGCDLVAYRDVVDFGFKAFYQGRFLDIEPVMPTRYEVGKGVMAYQDVNGALKVFEDGKVYTALDFPPQEWFVMDSLVVIKDQNFLKVFDNGKLHVVERFWPSVWSASWGSIAYLDLNRNVKLWHANTSFTLTRGEPVKDILLERGLLIANLTVNSVKIGWRGRSYEH